MKISRFNRILALLLVLALAFSDCNIPGVKAEEISAQTEEDAQYTESSEEESAEAEETTENDASENDEAEDASETVEPADEGGSDEAEAVEENTDSAEEGGNDEAEAVEENTEPAEEGGSDETEAVEENTEAADEGGSDETEAVEENTEPAEEDGNGEPGNTEDENQPEDELLPPVIGTLNIEDMIGQPDDEEEDIVLPAAVPEDENGFIDLDLGEYSEDLYIYNYMSYTDAGGTVQSGANGYSLRGTSSRSITIGDTEGDAADSNRPLEKDIPVVLKGLEMKEDTVMTIRPVFGGKNAVILDVNEASDIAALNVADGAVLEMNLNADVSIGSLSLGEGSSLTIHTNGHACTVSGDISGSGKIQLLGNGTAAVSGNLEASELTVDSASVKAANVSVSGSLNLTNANLSTADENGTITAEGDITVNGGSVSDAALFGYRAEVQGEKTITFSGNGTFSRVGIVGAAEGCGAKVTMIGLDSIGSSSDTVYICDYSITYKEEETVLAPQPEWPVSYRVRHEDFSSSGGTILGSHTGSGYAAAEGNRITLPVYAKEGYGYAGWMTDASAEPILEIENRSGDLTLTAVLAAGEVSAVLDLGYDPDENTNDLDEDEKIPERLEIKEGTKLGDILTLDTPSRFGYLFKGWKAVTGTLHDTYEDSYTVALSDLTMNEETKVYELTLEAQWEAELFPLRLVLSSNVPSENAEISIDGGSNWMSMEELGKTDGIYWEASSKQVSFDKNIAYGESLGAYFEELGWKYPMLQDNREASIREKFVTWTTNNGTAVTEASLFTIGEGGILENRGSKTLKEYQAYLLDSPVILTTQWGTMEYTITTDTAEGWSILVDGEEVTPDEKGQIKVLSGSQVSWRCSSNAPSNVNIGTWKFAYVEGDRLVWLNPLEREYHSGDRYLYYDFTMPTADVAAACSGKKENGGTSFGTELLEKWADALGIKLDLGDGAELWINLADSPITFEENVAYNHRRVEGFWYDRMMTQMTPLFAVKSDGSQTNTMGDDDIAKYFYLWNFDEPFYVTSKNEPTQNQLTLINAMTVYLKDCNLAATDAYSEDVEGRKIENYAAEGHEGSEIFKNTSGNWAAYGNIVLDNETHNSYTTNLYFDGPNTVAAIFPSRYQYTTTYKGLLNLYGKNDGLVKLGSIWGNTEVSAENLFIETYEDEERPDRSEYLFALFGNDEGACAITFKDCKLNVPEKRIQTRRGSIKYQGTTQAVIGSSYHYSSTVVNGTSFLHVKGDLMGSYHSIDVSGSGKLVVDGNILRRYSHQGAGATIGGNAVVIVKGNRFDAGYFRMSGGTLIVNALVLGRQCSITGGTIVSNQIMNSPSQYPYFTDGDGKYLFNYDGSCTRVTENGDDIPFTTWAQADVTSGTFTFKGGKIYLLGYYELSGDKTYNAALRGDDTGNPLKDILDKVVDGEGNITGTLSPDDALAAVNSSSVQNGSSECLVFGRSDYAKGTAHYREVAVSGTEFYAAGNMTFYNDTTISGGSITCAGTLASKRDLTVSGGIISAREVGNAYDLTTTTADQNTRWQKTVISGGQIRADRLGALSGAKNRSTLDITGGQIVPYADGGEVTLVHDMHINYIAGKEIYTNPEENPQTVRFVGTSYSVSSLEEMQMELTADDATLAPASVNLKIENPGLVNPDSGENAIWRLDSLSGSQATGITKDGGVQGADMNAIQDASAVLREQLPLYATKDSYKLTIKEGADAVSSLTADRTDVADSYENNVPMPVSADKEVVLTLKAPAVPEKTVVWYFDDNGVLHNAMPAAGDETITFKMPAADTEIYITDDLHLYLNLYEIAFTENGFRVEYDESREDSTFFYKGNLTVCPQSSVGTKIVNEVGTSYSPVLPNSGKAEDYETKNRLKFEKGSGNAEESGLQRTITVDQVMQTGGSMDYGTEIADGEQVELTISGAVQLLPIHVTENTDFTVKGKTDAERDALYIRVSNAQSRLDLAIGNGAGKAGSVKLKDLTLLRYTTGRLVLSSAKSANPVVFENCRMHANLASASSLAWNMDTITLNHCEFQIDGNTGYTTYPFYNCTEVKLLNGTKVDFIYGASQKAYSFFSGVSSMELEDSELHIKLRNTTASAVYYERQNNDLTAKTVTLSGNSVFTADHRLRLNKLVLNGDSRAAVGSESEPGYLFCPDIEVNENASLDAGYVIVSGFHNPANINAECLLEDNFQAKAAAGTDILDGAAYSGLVINGGAVKASKFAGGDVNGKVTVNGGSLTAGKIGTYGALFGFAQYIPKAEGEAYAYTYAKIPPKNAAKVMVTDGTVTVMENGYLGGMNSEVEVSGGRTSLGNGAVLGMTEEDKTTMLEDASSRGETVADACSVEISGGSVSYSGTGSISAPYGSVTISGEATKVEAYNLLAERGSILIKEAAEGLTNPYNGTDGIHKEVGVLVGNQLAAQNVKIAEEAVVYANEAYSNAPAGTEGSFTVTSTPEKATAHLYVGKGYGPAGDGEITVDANPSGKNKNVYGARVVSIRYVLNDNSVDRASNEENPETYTVGQLNGEGKAELALADPIRSGYEFRGWYEEADFSGPIVSSLNTNNQKDLLLYAKWEPVKVRFSISVDTEKVPNLEDETSGLKGDYDAEQGTFTFAATASVAYLDNMFGVSGDRIHLTDYALKSHEIIELVIDDDAYSGPTSLNAGSSVVTKALVQAYLAKVDAAEESEKDQVSIHLKAANVVKTRIRLTLSMNLNEKSRPKSSRFNYITAPEYGTSTNTTISSYVDIGKTIGDAAGFADAEGKLISASAPGYSFGGWYLNPEGTGTAASAEDIITKDSAGVLYAKWTPNNYVIQFDAGEGGVITKSESNPAGDEEQTLDGTVTYDEIIDENIRYESDAPGGGLPYGWKKGQAFDGWAFTDSKGNTVTVTDADELNLTDIPVLNTEKTADGTEAALTLTAVYRPVKITYHPEGGSWKNEAYGNASETVTVDGIYGDALAGYTKNDTDYVIISTDAKYFEEHQKQYLPDDYRHTVMRKGYTFAGWYTTEEAAEKAGNGEAVAAEYGPVGTVPEYEDAELYAAWTPNQYTLSLHEKDDQMTYKYTDFSYQGSAKTASVTVGQEIADIADWPSRDSESDAWYAYNKDTNPTEDSQKRYLLGFTFDGLDPGTTDQENAAGYQVYQTYASSVTSLLNSNNLFQKKEKETAGSIFRIPDSSYGNDVIPGTNTVPDYPSGATIPMYAVYREISLVFVQYVQTENGVEQKVMASYPWNSYVDYPMEYQSTADYKELTNKGYALVNWYLHAPNPKGTVYSKSEYETNKDRHKETAKDSGTYDIMVYTVYAAQVTVKNVTLTAKSDPTADQNSTYTYTLPGSMQAGPLSYEIEGLKGLKLVSLEELSEHLYDSEWTAADGSKHTADDTVAVGIALSYNGEQKAVGSLSGTGGKVSDLAAQAGWRITLTLYHSRVMEKDNTFEFNLNFTFGENLESQYLKFEPVKIIMTPSVYKVEYDANLPEDEKRSVTDWAGFDETSEKQTLSVPYGGALLDRVPTVEGYIPVESWYVTDENGTKTVPEESAGYGTSLKFQVSEKNNGKIYVLTDWTVNMYDLSADKETQERWDIICGDTEMTGGSAKVPYHTKVTFKPKTNTEKAAYIFLNIGEKRVRLDEYAEEYGTVNSDGSFTFPMPASDVKAEYATTMGLYLENGTIEITPEGYTQNGKTVTWPGDYEILMDEANNEDGSVTPNILSLSGDLSGHRIVLGNLNISSDDSIRLLEGTKAELTTEYEETASAITAKNILVPEEASLTMNGGSSEKGKLELTPSEGKAAIGGSNAANGAIDLKNLEIQMSLSAPSSASGIGSGNQSAGGKEVVVENCVIAVKETSTASGVYQGAWIGGKGVSSVTVQDSQVILVDNSDPMVGPYVLNGTFVKVIDSEIGTEEKPVFDPIYAEQTLTINGSHIYQEIESNLTILGAVSAVGTSESGTIEVTKSTIQTNSSGAGKTEKLYTGTMKIRDPESDVMILNTQILEMSHGSVKITDTKAVQGDSFLIGNTTHTHSGSYLLLEELPPNESNAPDLTVNSLAANAVITVKQPAKASNNMAVMLHALSVSTDVPVILDGNLKVGGTVKIAEGKTLSVTADEDSAYGVDFTDETPFEDIAAAYEQTNGSLKCPEKNGAAGGEKLTVKLDGVTAVVHSLYAKDLTLIDSKVTADSTAGVVGSMGKTDAVTHVTIEGKTDITAKTIGSLGTADGTFTLVDIKDEDTFTWTGNLVRDRYRLEYVLEDSNFDNSANPLVLRTEQENGKTETVIPLLPKEPVYTAAGSSYFETWYILGENKTPTALSETEVAGFDARLEALLPGHIEYAEAADQDGTRTLKIYAWMKVQGTGTITEGRQFEEFETEDTTVSVPADGAWTALFTSTGASIANSSYQAVFEDALPKGTRLTLAVLKESGVPEYYYQVLDSESNKVLFDEFIRMGSEDTMYEHQTGTVGAVEDRFLLAVDFAGAETEVRDDQTVSFEMVIDNSPMKIAEVAYSLTDIQEGRIEVSNPTETADGFTGTVTVIPPSDRRLAGKQIVLLAEWQDAAGNAVTVPYGAEMALTDSGNTKIPADWIGGSRALFRLGAYGSVPGGSSYTWNLGGLETGAYTITWKLASAEDEKDVNVLGSLLKAEEVSVTLSRAEVEPSLKVTLDLIDGTASAGRVLAAGQSHSIGFSCSTHDDNSTEVTVKAEKQNTLASFGEASTSDVTCAVNADKSVTVEFSDSASGTYRIRFSIAEGSEEDDVYYTFIVK